MDTWIQRTSCCTHPVFEWVCLLHCVLCPCRVVYIGIIWNTSLLSLTFSHLSASRTLRFGGSTWAKSCRLHKSGTEQEQEFPLSTLSLMEKVYECEAGPRWNSHAYSYNLTCIHTLKRSQKQSPFLVHCPVCMLWFQQDFH